MLITHMLNSTERLKRSGEHLLCYFVFRIYFMYAKNRSLFHQIHLQKM